MHHLNIVFVHRRQNNACQNALYYADDVTHTKMAAVSEISLKACTVYVSISCELNWESTKLSLLNCHEETKDTRCRIALNPINQLRPITS